MAACKVRCHCRGDRLRQVDSAPTRVEVWRWSCFAGVVLPLQLDSPIDENSLDQSGAGTVLLAGLGPMRRVLYKSLADHGCAARNQRGCHARSCVVHPRRVVRYSEDPGVTGFTGSSGQDASPRRHDVGLDAAFSSRPAATKSRHPIRVVSHGVELDGVCAELELARLGDEILVAVYQGEVRPKVLAGTYSDAILGGCMRSDLSKICNAVSVMVNPIVASSEADDHVGILINEFINLTG